MEYTDPRTGQSIGAPLPGWTARARPARIGLEGRSCRVEAFRVEAHAGDLWEVYADDTTGANWTYLGYGPFATQADFTAKMHELEQASDPLFYAVLTGAERRATGLASLMRIDPANGVIEVGHIHYSQRLKGSTAATEAMFLLMRHVFDDLGYRRYEWKCDSLNSPSRAAALRLGFTYEGIFRQATVYKGRSRDTAWYSIIDREWPALRARFERWLDPANFDASGRQLRRLSEC